MSKMKLWILFRKHVDWDEYVGGVIRTNSARDARLIAGNEWDKRFLDSNLTTCEELSQDGDPGVVISDFNAG